MAEWEDSEITSPHKHIKNTSTCGALLTESWLETGRKTFYNQGWKKDPRRIE